MPQVFKRKGSPFFYARWQHRGEDRIVSTKCTNRREALVELDRLRKASRGELTVNDEFDRLQNALAVLPEKDQSAKRQEFAKKLLMGKTDKLRIADGWSQWTANPNKKRTPKSTTLSGYEAIWKRFNEWATARGVEFFHDVDEKLAKAYAQDLWNSKISPSTFNAHIKFLMAVFRLLETEAGLTTNVWNKITRKEKPVDTGRRNFSEAELRTILARADGNLRVMFSIGLFTGLRLGDVVNLRWADIDAKPGFISIIPMKTSRLQKKVETPIHPGLKRVLDDFRRGNHGEYLFPEKRELYRESVANITKPLQEFFEGCNIRTTEQCSNGERRRRIVRIGFHSLRHSFVSLCAANGAPQHVIQKLVGHGSPAMTEHYTHVDGEQKTSAIAGLPELIQPAA